jgi:hypothetical protein
MLTFDAFALIVNTLRNNSRNTTSNQEKDYTSKNNDFINEHPLSFSFGVGFDFGAFRVEINRIQNALKAYDGERNIETDCECFIEYPSYVYYDIPSIHTTLISLKYKL